MKEEQLLSERPTADSDGESNVLKHDAGATVSSFEQDGPSMTFVLLDRAHDDSYHVGHVWIEWDSDLEGQHAFRGYYPDFSSVAEDLRVKLQNVDEWFRFFPQHAVPGRFERDVYAQELRERRKTVFAKDWQLDGADQARLERRCFIPPGRDHKPEGLYSWNEKEPEEHNCSSWAVSVVNHTKDDLRFLVCIRPKRLKHVKQAVWGS